MPWVVDDNPAPPKKGWVPDTAAEKPKKSALDVAKDAGQSFVSGLGEGAGQLLGMAGDYAQHAAVEPIQNALKLAGVLTGRDTSQLRKGAGDVADVVLPKTTAALETDRKAAGLDYAPQTTLGSYAHTGASFAPAAALGGGGVVARAANVIIPAAVSETAGQITQGTKAEPYARAAGAMIGGGITGAGELAFNALKTRSAAEPIDLAANALRGKTNVDAATARAADLRGAGANPAFVSATDESGRGFVRAAASRNTSGREVVQQRADASALNLPDRIGMQARTHLSSDPRTPDAIASDLATARGKEADAAFGAVRGETITMQPQTVEALRTGHGRAAITEAAQRERDPEVRAALNRLAADALDDPSTPITVGMADRISRVLAGKAQAAARTGDNDLATTLGNLSRDIRKPAAAAVPEYGDALAGYADQTRTMEAAGKGEDFLKRNTDEFVADAPASGQPGNDLARATARRAIERAAGENTSAAPGVARKLAYAPEQQARNAHLLGPEAAGRFQGSMAAEARVNRDMQDVAPRTGSQTQLRTADQESTSKVLDGVETLAGGPRAWVKAAATRLKTIGLSDEQAAAVADVATDPARLDELLTLIAKHPGGQKWILPIQRAIIDARSETQKQLPPKK